MVAYPFRLGIKAEADAEEGSRVGGEGEGIAFFFYLGKGFSGGGIKFQFHEVNKTVGLDENVDEAVGSLVFHTHTRADKTEEKIKYKLIMRLIFACMLM